jgi:ribonucleoside-diphosphate reductase subunit M2
MNDSPIKKLDFSAGKENLPYEAQALVDAVVETKKPAVEESKLNLVAPTIRLEEADEPLLQANPHRFVLFPIKYHEVRFFNRVAALTLARHA